VEIRLKWDKDRFGEHPGLLERGKVWKAGLIDVLKNSPSEARKFLRWNLAKTYRRPVDNRFIYEVVEAEELEVFP